MPSKQAAMSAIAAELETLTASPLYAYRVENGYRVVVGEGSLDAAIMFIGEAPGASEAQSGRPFVGASGRVLAELLAGIGLRREDVYITNVVKDRPPDNRDPRADEIALYAPFLRRQIELIQPQVIAPLGRHALTFVLALFDAPAAGQKIGDLHGRPLAAQAAYGPITIVPLYHPAVALYNRDQRATLEADFEALKALIAS